MRNEPLPSVWAPAEAPTEYKATVRLATTAALAANTRTGNTLLADANGALANIDGVAPVVGNRILVKDEATGANRGIYSVTSLGSAGTKWQFDRVPDMDDSAEVVSGLLVFVAEGTLNGSTTWRLTTADPITLNTTALTFALAMPGSLLGVQVLIAGVSYTPTRGTKAIEVELVGGGGGGGGATTAAVSAASAGGGAAGGYASKRYTGIGAGPYTYAVGAAGAAGTDAGGTGGTGGDSTFTDGVTLVTAKGGLGGVGMAAGVVAEFSAGGAGVVPTNGDINAPGDPGSPGARLSGTMGCSGAGGSSPWGGGGVGLAAAGVGSAGGGRGGGGAGGLVLNGSAAVAGGAGAAGALRISEYA